MRGSGAAAPPVHGPAPVLDLRTSQIRTSGVVIRQRSDVANQRPVVDRVRVAR